VSWEGENGDEEGGEKGKGSACFCLREKGTTAEAERNKQGDREAKGGSLLKTTSRGKKGRERKRTLEVAERTTCCLIRCIYNVGALV